MLPEVDRVEILTVLDLLLDLLMAGSDTVRRVDVAGTFGEGRSTLRLRRSLAPCLTRMSRTAWARRFSSSSAEQHRRLEPPWALVHGPDCSSWQSRSARRT
jgi:hypothetical protein